MNELQKDTNTRTVSSGKYVLPVGAKVYVKVTCYGVGNQYKIRSNYYATEGWEKESNDTMAFATDLTVGKTLHGSINSKRCGLLPLRCHGQWIFQFQIYKCGRWKQSVLETFRI